MERLCGIGKEDMGRELNGRLHYWSLSIFQHTLDRRAKLEGIRVCYVDPKGTSSRCPRCGGKLIVSGYRELECPECGMKGDRDAIACLNILGRLEGNVEATPCEVRTFVVKRGRVLKLN